MKPREPRRPKVSKEAQRTEALAVVEAWHKGFDATAALGRDPLAYPRKFADRHDREVVALLAALMAFGRVAIIRAKLDDLLARLGPSPSGFLQSASREDVMARLRGFRHRTFAGEDLAGLLFAAGKMQSREGGLYVALERAYAARGSLREALGDWVETLRTEAWPDGMTRARRHMLPDPSGASASKRVLLLLRWITRPDEGVDLGLASLPTSALLMPVDVHIHRIAKNLGFTARNDASWRTSEEITAALRGLSVSDPVRYDLSLCHLGIAGRCPSRKDPERCEGCALRSVCVHWR